MPGAAVVVAASVVAACLGPEYGLGYTFCYTSSVLVVAVGGRRRLAVLAIVATAALAVGIGLAFHLEGWDLALQAMITLSGGLGTGGQCERLRRTGGTSLRVELKL